MRAVICVVNIARGVRKTNTAVSLAAELASAGFETLLLDADLQADATASFIDPESVRLSVADLVLAPAPSPQGRPAETTRFELEDVVVPTVTPRLRLAPSRIGLAAAEGDPPLGRDALSELLSEYGRPCDFAVIDTPSSFGPIAAACAVALTHLLVPVAPNTQGMIIGLRCLVEFLGDMPYVRGRVELLGVLCNLFDSRSRPSGEFYESLKDEWGDKVLETIIHRDDLIEACAGRRLPVRACTPTSVAATLHAGRAGETLLRLGVAASARVPTVRPGPPGFQSIWEGRYPRVRQPVSAFSRR